MLRVSFQKIKVLFILLPAIVLCSQAIAQDTVFNYNPYLTSYYHINDPTAAFHLDTTISHFNRYNPAEELFGYLHTGHLGAAAAPMFFIPPKNAAFDIGFHQFDVYWRETDAVKFYDSKRPYTKVGYQQGAKVEVLGSFIHTQNILPRWSVGANLNRYRVDGFYQRQVSKITNFDAFTRYNSENGFYHLNVGYTLNSLKVEENGGVENLDVFVDTTLLDKSQQPVLLDSAFTNWKNDAVFFQNAIDLGKWQEVKKNDSVNFKKVIPNFRIQHFFKWERKSFRFSDDAIDNAFYKNIYLDSLKTRDTLWFDAYSNELRMRLLEKNQGLLKDFYADAYFHHDLYQMHSHTGNRTIQNGIAGFEVRKSMLSDTTKGRVLDFYLEGEYNFFDTNYGDYRLFFQTDLRVSRSNLFTIELQQSSNHPSYIQQNYLSNHFQWHNAFTPFQTSFAKASWVEEKWRLKLSAEIFSIKKYLYWNEEALPAQFQGTLNGLAIFLQKDFLLKGFHLDNEFQYQQFNEDTIITYPKFFLRQSLYFQNRLFKGALTSKIGIDVRYTGDYYAPSYMPETGQFFVQRFDVLNFYPVADLFITIQVKGVRAFAMFQNINKDLFAPGYFEVYRYPMPDRSFKLGLEWRFWN